MQKIRQINLFVDYFKQPSPPLIDPWSGISGGPMGQVWGGQLGADTLYKGIFPWEVQLGTWPGPRWVNRGVNWGGEMGVLFLGTLRNPPPSPKSPLVYQTIPPRKKLGISCYTFLSQNFLEPKKDTS